MKRSPGLSHDSLLPRPHPPRGVVIAGGVFALAAVTMLAHGWCLGDGTVLDDHWHQRGLREHGWSYQELMRSLVIEPTEWMHVWWQDKPVRWEYGRPLFILSMKFVYSVLGGNDPVALHAFSLALHFACALMIWRLCWMLARNNAASWLGGLLFIVYPHAVITVAWPSAQNCITATALMLAALLLYLRASGFGESGRDLEGRRNMEGEAPAEPSPLDTDALSHMGAPSRSAARGGGLTMSLWPLVGAFVLWIMALLTRENSLLLAPILVAFDFAFGGTRRVWARRGVYLAMAIIGTVFIIWRVTQVTTPMPDVYTRRPDGDFAGYLLWCAAKLIHYLATSVWIAPMSVGPTGRINPWSEIPGDMWAMTAIVAIVTLGYAALTWRQRGWWIWPVWIVLGVLPVIPVIATPHSGYLSGVGVAVGLSLVVAGARSAWARHPRRAIAIFYLVTMSVMTMLNRWQWDGIIAAERVTSAWIQADPPESQVTDVYFINLPFASVYAKPALDESLGAEFRDARFHVLTWSPDPIQVDGRTYIEQIDECTLTVRIDGQPYFSRLMGRFVLKAFAGRGPFRVGDTIQADGFEIQVLETNPDGVSMLQFSFDRPLSDPRSCFYLATPECGAAKLRFVNVSAGESAGLELTDPAFQTIAHTLAESLGSPMQDVLAAKVLSASDWRRVADWWRSTIDDRTLELLWTRRDEFLPYLKAREEVHNQRRRLAEYIRSDMYLTGPPFAGPR